jgi:putative mycofactocin binding protein MftB
VALRPEPFGALVYHFGNRKLSFLKSKALVAVVETLAEHPSADATLVACGVPAAQHPAYRKALADLARSQMIERRTSSQGPTVEGPVLPTLRKLRAGPGTGPRRAPATRPTRRLTMTAVLPSRPAAPPRPTGGR